MSLEKLEAKDARRPAVEPAPSSVWWMLHLIEKAGGKADAGDYGHNLLNAFCDDAHPLDTFNAAAHLGLIVVSHDSDFDTSTATITPRGRAWVAESAPRPVWRCFHCDDVFFDRASAADHFGTDWFCEDEGPACIQILTEGEKALVNDRREAGRLMREAEEAQEQAEQEAATWRTIARELTREPVAHASGLRFAWESLEGRALASEAALDAAPRWLSRLLRWKAERDWRRAQRAAQPGGGGQ